MPQVAADGRTTDSAGSVVVVDPWWRSGQHTLHATGRDAPMDSVLVYRLPPPEAIEHTSRRYETGAPDASHTKPSDADEQLPVESVVDLVPALPHQPVAALRGPRAEKPESLDPLGLIPSWLAGDGTQFDAAREDAGEERDSQITARVGTPTLAKSHWTAPTTLLESLDELSWECVSSDWALRVSSLIGELCATPPPSSTEAAAILTELRHSSGEIDRLVRFVGEGQLAASLRRARHALVRRLDVWEMAQELLDENDAQFAIVQPDPHELAVALADVESLVRTADTGDRWRDYLRLDALDILVQSGQAHVTDRSRELAQQIVTRLERRDLDASQREFISTGPLAALGDQLQAWAIDPISVDELLSTIESYEANGLPSEARRLAVAQQQLTWSADATHRSLAESLEARYRNANIRLAVTDDLVERLLPDAQTSSEPVADTVIGVPVRGRSTVSSTVDVQLVPDDERLRMVLDVSGLVSARTRSWGNWGTVFNQSHANYHVTQPLAVGTSGLEIGTPSATARNRTRMRGLRTRWDGIPLIGSLSQAFVRRGQSQRAPAARRESEAKIRQQAIAQTELQAGAMLRDVEQRMTDELLDPLTQLGLDPTVVEMRTTEQRVTLRARLAGEEQLGSHTPRPRAPSDSLASVQFHQSAVNNLIDSLELDGRSATLAELHADVLQRFGRPPQAAPESMPDDVTLRFAAQDAARVTCDEGRVHLAISVAELAQHPRRWNNFTVHVYYRPTADIRQGELVRDGVIQLEGRLNMRSQIALRGVFSKIFSDDRPISVVPPTWRDNPKLAGLEITQLEINDGWVGVALGPQRAVRQPIADLARAR